MKINKFLLFLLIVFFPFTLFSTSQSAAFLQVDPFEKIVHSLPFASEYQEWLHEIVKQEEAYQDDYYVVYHACTGLSLFQDLLKLALEKYLHVSFPEDFTFMRTPWKKIYQIKDVDDYFERFGMPHLPERSPSMEREWVETCLTLLEVDLTQVYLSEDEITKLQFFFFCLWVQFDLHEIESNEGFYLIQTLLNKNYTLNDFKEHFHEKVGFLKESIPSHLSERDKNLRNKLSQIEIDYNNYISNLCTKFQDHLLAVNLTLFGNYDSGSDCTLEYWHSRRNHIPKDTVMLLKDVLSLFNLNDDSLKDVLEIYDLIRQQDNVIFAIYIPKSIVDKVLYLSYGFYDLIIYECMSPSEVLMKYQTNIQEIKHYKILEGRLVFTQNYLLDPYSGIKFIKHHIINKDVYSEYQQRLKDWAEINFRI